MVARFAGAPRCRRGGRHEPLQEDADLPVALQVARDAGGWGVMASLIVRAHVAAGISWFAWRVLGAQMPLPMAIVFGCLVAILVAFAFRLVTREDVKFLFALRKPASSEAYDES